MSSRRLSLSYPAFSTVILKSIIMVSIPNVSVEIWDFCPSVVIGCKGEVGERLAALVSIFDICLLCWTKIWVVRHIFRALTLNTFQQWTISFERTLLIPEPSSSLKTRHSTSHPFPHHFTPASQTRLAMLPTLPPTTTPTLLYPSSLSTLTLATSSAAQQATPTSSSQRKRPQRPA